MDEVPLNEMDDKGGILISAEIPGGNDDDSQQVAEAMVQLGTMGYYHQSETNEAMIFKGRVGFGIYFNLTLFFVAEESLDVDPNYDPSDFLMSGLPMNMKRGLIKEEELDIEECDINDMKMNDDLAVSDSEEEVENTSALNISQTPSQEEELGDEDIWF